MRKINYVIALCFFCASAKAQILTVPTGTTVNSNITTDQVIVNGYLRVTNSSSRGFMIEKDNDDSWLTFHDPSDYWYSMGIDHSNNGSFVLNSGGTLGYLNHFVMNNNGNIGVGVPEAWAKVHINGSFGLGKFSDSQHAGLLATYTDGEDGTTTFLHQRWGGDYYFRRNSSGGERTQLYFGGSDNHRLDIFDNNNQVKVRLTTAGDSYFAGGSLGLGTTSPAAVLDVATFAYGGSLASVLARQQEGNSTGSGTFLGVTGYETQMANYAGKSFALEHSFYGVKNSSINFFRGDEETGGYLTFNTNDNTERLRITTAGDVGIGTNNPDAKLTVAGDIHSREVKVTVDAGTGPDYVFEPTYQLPSLTEIENYIKANKHLPEVPSAKEMETNGINLSEMNMLLLKKVEELTLYMIEMKSEFEQLKSKNELLETKIKAFEAKDKIK